MLLYRCNFKLNTESAATFKLEISSVFNTDIIKYIAKKKKKSPKRLKKRTLIPALKVLTLEYQKDTSKNENKPTPSQEIKKNVRLFVFISKNIKNKKKPIKIEKRVNSTSFLK